MCELMRPTIAEASVFTTMKGYPLSSDDILKVFPTYFPERRVIQVRTKGRESSRILKFRPFNEKAKLEITNLEKLLASYRFAGVHLN